MKQMMRVWLEGTRQTLVVVAGPLPKVGDELKMPDGTTRRVTRVSVEQGIEVKFPAKAKGRCLKFAFVDTPRLALDVLDATAWYVKWRIQFWWNRL